MECLGSTGAALEEVFVGIGTKTVVAAGVVAGAVTSLAPPILIAAGVGGCVCVGATAAAYECGYCGDEEPRVITKRAKSTKRRPKSSTKRTRRPVSAPVKKKSQKALPRRSKTDAVMV